MLEGGGEGGERREGGGEKGESERGKVGGGVRVSERVCSVPSQAYPASLQL